MQGATAQEGNANAPEPRPPVILHLSDLHFTTGDNAHEKADRKEVLDSLLALVSGLEGEWRPTIVCVSGDIAGRGNGAAPDYNAASTWLRELLDVVEIGVDRLVICPGNHDLDQKKALERPKSTRQADEEFSDGEPPRRSAAFSEFEQFCENLDVTRLRVGDSSSYLAGTRDPIDGIQFVVLNSSWFSGTSDKEGRVNDEEGLWLGLPLMKILALPEVHGICQVPTTISVFHHPFSKLHEEESKAHTDRQVTKEYLAQRCHVGLTGHVHGKMTESKPDRLCDICPCIVGGAIYADPSGTPAAHLIQVMKDRIRFRVLKRDPNEGSRWTCSEPKECPYGDPERLQRERDILAQKIGTLSGKGSGLSEDFPRPGDREPFSVAEERGSSQLESLLPSEFNPVPEEASDNPPEDSSEMLARFTLEVSRLFERRELRDAYMLAERVIDWLTHHTDERGISLPIREDFRCVAAEAQTAWALVRQDEGDPDWKQTLEKATQTLEGLDDGPKFR